jgi:hypothetical protein
MTACNFEPNAAYRYLKALVRDAANLNAVSVKYVEESTDG